MAEKQPKPRFKERKERDDDEDDDRPSRTRPPRADEEDDDADEGIRRRARQRVVGSDRPPVLFLLGLVFGTVLLLGCCGVGGWGAYSVLVGGGGPSWGGNEFEIVYAARTPGFGFNAPPQVGWKAIVKSTPDSTVQTYYMVMKSGTVTNAAPFTIPALKGAEVSQSMPQPTLRNAAGPLELWVERRTDPNTAGKRVSNVYRVP